MTNCKKCDSEISQFSDNQNLCNVCILLDVADKREHIPELKCSTCKTNDRMDGSFYCESCYKKHQKYQSDFDYIACSRIESNFDIEIET